MLDLKQADIAIISFPGANCDRDIQVACHSITGKPPRLVWHTHAELGRPDLVILPGGFTFGDYLRQGAIAAHSPIMDEVREHAWRGGYILGICNGFQILLEMGLLEGVLLPNKHLRFICRDIAITAVSTDNPMLSDVAGMTLTLPIAHIAGNYFTDPDTLARLHDKEQIAFTYTNSPNPNGSLADIAGILSDNKRILGLMPHPERKIDAIHSLGHGGRDGRVLLKSVIAAAI
ncbi:MAG: phosphoribosylformylglycinamidine synthase subunit PurQ [Proteobacteria bacterium]|nr:phosphoribosylformylglycinamidine synthase subunit PurQ [Pseudomonadota bacterium]